MNIKTRSILFPLIAALCSFGVSSCTVITTGFWLDEIGQLEPKEHQAGELRQVYQGDDYVYVQVPIVFIQNKQPVIRHLNMMDLWINPVPYVYPNNKYSDISSPENYFLRLPSSCVTQEGIVSVLDGRDENQAAIRLLSEKEVNLTSCKRIQDVTVCCPHELLTTQRTWGNQLRRPLAWCCMLADIPLTIISNPVGWMVDIVSYPFFD